MIFDPGSFALGALGLYAVLLVLALRRRGGNALRRPQNSTEPVHENVVAVVKKEGTDHAA